MATTELVPAPGNDLRSDYHRYGFDALSDAELVTRVARTLAVPRVDPADSFVLHAPLELVARVALLPSVHPAQHEQARLRLFALADEFEAFGPPVARPEATRFDSVADAADRLLAAIDWGELDDIDVAARWLGQTASAAQLQAALTDAITPRLGAAAHAPIFLFQLPRVARRGAISGELLRGLARELGRNPQWRLRWMDGIGSSVASETSATAMFEAVAATPHRRLEGPTPFIFPLMSAVDDTGIAARLLAEVTRGRDIRDRGRSVLRAAAWSMLLEPRDHAPYGWSHALTMAQAVLGISDHALDPSDSLAVAATYVVGFRAALARNPLEPEFPNDSPPMGWRDALGAGPELAAAAVWHADPSAYRDIHGELATRASVHRDAHLVKYTLACFDAATSDPSHRRLFLAAAASLGGWWARVSDRDDPLAT